MSLLLAQIPQPAAEEQGDAAANGAAAPGARLAEGDKGGLRLALGGAPRVQLDKKQSLVVMGDAGPLATIPLPCPDLPERVLQSIAAIAVRRECVCGAGIRTARGGQAASAQPGTIALLSLARCWCRRLTSL